MSTFVADQGNVVLVGGTGTGKSHLAIAIARSLIRNGTRGRFFNVVDLVNRMETETRSGKQGRTADYLNRLDFIILDELGYAHHVAADMTYRLGDRPGRETKGRVLNAPTEGEGEAICLTQSEHTRKGGSGGVHDNMLKALKGIDHPHFPGTASMRQILKKSQEALLATKGIDTACAKAANARAEPQVKANTGMRAPGRIKEKPLPTGKIADDLRAGRYP
ncbi:IstB-like ATP binding protein [Rhizobium sp. PP-F2F-G48]|nr:IstB-like ATP binding protein [Rhizobium sp. PP-F2F-G48]